MKSKFPGYFKLSEKEISKLWDNALFTFDANILLNFYRYSDETREEFIKILEKLKERIWIPHQSAQEFFDNRLSVISQQEKAYEDAIASINSMENEFKNSRKHPFIPPKLLKRFSELSKEICESLNSSKDFHNKRIIEDDILDKVESLFDNKVGNEFNDEELRDLYKEGEIRFANKIPPGFKDSTKKDETEANSRKFGDLIVWKQTINKSKELKQAIILVTDDRKEDWWVRFKGKTISPRPELVKEFKLETQNSFYMYQSDRFLEFARDYLNEHIDQKVIEEIRELRRLDERNRLTQLRKEKELLRYHEFKENLIKERMMLNEELKFLIERKNHLENSINENYLINDNGGEYNPLDEQKIRKQKQEYMVIEKQLEHLLQKINEIKEREIEIQIRNKTLHNMAYK